MNIFFTYCFLSFFYTGIDDCKIGLHFCSVNESCLDGVGSFERGCSLSFNKNELTCEGILHNMYYINFLSINKTRLLQISAKSITNSLIEITHLTEFYAEETNVLSIKYSFKTTQQQNLFVCYEFHFR